MRLAVVQTAADPDPARNRAAVERLTGAAQGAELVVFPEAMARDFGAPGSPLTEWAEPLDGPFVAALQASARKHRTTVVAGMFETNAADPRRPYNTLVCTDGSAVVGYRKVHLYDSFGFRESEVITGGELKPVVTEVAGIRVGLMTCYDLRFPEHSRALVGEGAELLVLPAAWVAGDRKVMHWETLLRARAIENLCYVAGAGQSSDRYCGHSQILSPRGDVLAAAGDGEAVLVAEVDPDDLAQARADNPSLDNRRW